MTVVVRQGAPARSRRAVALGEERLHDRSRGDPAPLLAVPDETLAAYRRRRRARLAVVLTSVFVGIGLFGLVVFNVLLTQNQFELDRLQARAAEKQARYEQLRLQVAQLESPSRIVATAQHRLGMVAPQGITYLLPPAPVPGAPQPPADAAGPHTGWTAVKPHLAFRP